MSEFESESGEISMVEFLCGMWSGILVAWFWKKIAISYDCLEHLRQRQISVVIIHEKCNTFIRDDMPRGRSMFLVHRPLNIGELQTKGQ